VPFGARRVTPYVLTPEIVGYTYKSTVQITLGVQRQDNLDRGRLRLERKSFGYANPELS
jgi:hypothetical protein